MGNKLIAVIGLGYVGLPLAVEFGKSRNVVGFDINQTRVAELQANVDSTGEMASEALCKANLLKFTSEPEDIQDAKIFIVTVPTPINKNFEPDLFPLESATKTVGALLKQQDIVIFESTVYPGLTEEVCVPILEAVSGLSYNRDFFCGYSPERINPGDPSRSIRDIVKVVSGSNRETRDEIQELYGTIIEAGTYPVETIAVAEASKVLENIQRDVNIALMNELSMICSALKIDTQSVIDAASTKWNFLDFRPGLVGGHCVSVDPYYLIEKAKAIGVEPRLIETSRNINESMPRNTACSIFEGIASKLSISDPLILVLGLTFKEGCSDLRNSKVFELVDQLTRKGGRVTVHDPYISAHQVNATFGINVIETLDFNQAFDVVVLAVPHEEFISMGAKTLRSLGAEKSLFFDLKGSFPKDQSDGRM